jgi:hypothetical protein
LQVLMQSLHEPVLPELAEGAKPLTPGNGFTLLLLKITFTY